jgi:Flp pilus assembly pilin Flp
MQGIISHRERAQGLVEYGLIIALVAVIAIAGLIVFGPAVSSLLSRLGGSVWATLDANDGMQLQAVSVKVDRNGRLLRAD